MIERCIMSFVLFAGCKYFGYMIGDRRCSDKRGNIIDENVEKVRKINSNLIFAAAGSENIIVLVYDYLSKYNNISFNEAITLLEDNYHLIYQYLLELIEKQNLKQNKNVNANIGLMSICNNVVMFTSVHLLNGEIKIKKIAHETENDVTMCYLGVGLGNLGKRLIKECL